MNDIYRVKSDSYTYYLRIPRKNRFWNFTQENYLFEMNLLNYLRTRDFPVSYPIPTNKKSYLGVLNAPEGIRYFSLHTEAAGELPDPTNVGHLVSMGRYLAKFHQLTESYVPQKTAMSWNFDKLIDHGIQRLKLTLDAEYEDGIHMIEAKAAHLIKDFNEITNNGDLQRWGIVHGDYVPSNLRIHENTLTAFDFEYCGFGYQIYDLAVMVHKTGIKNPKNKYFHAFLEGYREITPIEDRDIMTIIILSKLALISRFTISAGMIDLVGLLWVEEKIKNDLVILKQLL